jgi:hypothetical protein
MATLSVDVPHRCPAAEARRCCEATLAALKVRYAGYIGESRAVWRGSEADLRLVLTAPAKIAIEGTIEVAADVIRVRGRYTPPPFLPEAFVNKMVADAIRKVWADRCKACTVPAP